MFDRIDFLADLLFSFLSFFLPSRFNNFLRFGALFRLWDLMILVYIDARVILNFCVGVAEVFDSDKEEQIRGCGGLGMCGWEELKT